MNYYTIIILVTVLSMIMELIHLSENESLVRSEKKYLKAISCFVIIGAISEFFGIYLNEKSMDTYFIHVFVKFLEFSIAPIIPYFFCRVVNYDKMSHKVKFAFGIFICMSVLIEVINIFFPFIFYIDENNIYQRANFYFIYTCLYFIGIVCFIIVILNTAKKYQNKNIKSLFSMVVFFLIGIVIRKFDSSIRTDWLIVAILDISFISYYSDLVLKIDVLTKLLNRRTYENYLKKIDYTTCIIRFDINNFKKVNDTYGHQCGDMCLKIVAKTLLKAYGKYAYCYRTGGDEFDVIFKPNQLCELVSNQNHYDLYKTIDTLNENFDRLLSEQAKDFPMLKYGCSKGYGFFYGYTDSTSEGMQDKRYSAGTVGEVIAIADKRMYEKKEEMKQQFDGLNL